MKFNLILALIVLVAGFLFALNQIAPPERSGSNAIGLERTDCWFDKQPWELFTYCYYMHVPENHQQPEGRLIQFPVVYFKSKNVFSNKSPVLHLGGGGPGGPMYLDYSEGVDNIKEEHDDFSLKQGRDLIVIDVRGTGLAKPSLVCEPLVELQSGILAQNLSFEEEWKLSEPAYAKCIDQYKSLGHELTHFNSTSVAKDIDLLRTSLNAKALVLYGVSYGAVYAQEIAKNTPEIIESMVLDSAAFPHISMDEDHYDKALAPYRAIYNYCLIIEGCHASANLTQRRIWAIYEKLEQQPLAMTLENYNTGENVTALLNGNRFIASLINSVYSMAIFDDLAQIIEELEQGQTETMEPYFASYVAYMLDPQWGDLSAQAHYCYEMKPFANQQKLRQSIDLLPPGYIRDSAIHAFESNDFCEEMNVSTANRSFFSEKTIDVPTLFLHGQYDAITPLSDVRNEKKLFTHSRLMTYPTAHSVMTADACAEISAAKFVEDPSSVELSCW